MGGWNQFKGDGINSRGVEVSHQCPRVWDPGVGLLGGARNPSDLSLRPQGENWTLTMVWPKADFGTMTMALYKNHDLNPLSVIQIHGKFSPGTHQEPFKAKTPI